MCFKIVAHVRTISIVTVNNHTSCVAVHFELLVAYVGCFQASSFVSAVVNHFVACVRSIGLACEMQAFAEGDGIPCDYCRCRRIVKRFGQRCFTCSECRATQNAMGKQLNAFDDMELLHAFRVDKPLMAEAIKAFQQAAPNPGRGRKRKLFDFQAFEHANRDACQAARDKVFGMDFCIPPEA
jgi:hypothetical protein